MYTAIIFVLFDIFWIILDFQNFQMSLEDMREMGTDLAFSGILALSSILASRWLVRVARRKGWGRWTSDVLTLVINALIAVGLELAFEFLLSEEWGDYWGNAYMISLIATLLCFVHSLHISHHELLRQQRENEALRMALLKRQLEPHFVFNSLNTLVGLIGTDTARAEDYAIRLSGVYRYVLRQIDRDLVPIGESLDFVRNYAELLRARYPYLNVTIGHFDYEADEKILSLSLQLLIENAVKHNTPPEGLALRMRIERHDDTLIISNNTFKSTAKPEGFGIGLDNLQRRTELICHRPIMIQSGGLLFAVTIPIIKR